MNRDLYFGTAMKSIIEKLSRGEIEGINLKLPQEQLDKEMQLYDKLKEHLTKNGTDALDDYTDVVSLNYEFLVEQTYALAFKTGFLLCLEITNTEDI